MLYADLVAQSVEELASHFTAMSIEEVFATMRQLEVLSENVEGEEREEVLSRIALVEEEIERRFPGQLLAPYRDWKKSQPLL
jgi:ABC-type proline/glycine betaine transport system ATPase subunit